MQANTTKKLFICLGLLLAAGLLGCAPTSQPQPEPAPLAGEPPVATPEVPVPTETPAPTPSPEESATALEQAWREAFLAQPIGEGPAEQTINYEAIIAERERWLGLTADIEQAAKAAYEQACAGLGLQPGGYRFEYPGWKLTASLVHRFGPYTQELLANNSVLAVEVNSTASMLVDCRDLRALIDGEEGEGRFGAKLTYAYINTVYDEEGIEKDFEQYPLSEEYLKNLQDPLPGHHIKNGWYNDRDRGKRKHTGTDIRAAENTEILSCTDGIVMNINSNSGAGNYVVVIDDEGFEYHYYHMVRLTEFLQVGDRVEKGDCVGHIGNTGNSSANHLHLTVISPAYTYINPYPMLRDMRALQEEIKK